MGMAKNISLNRYSFLNDSYYNSVFGHDIFQDPGRKLWVLFLLALARSSMPSLALMQILVLYILSL